MKPEDHDEIYRVAFQSATSDLLEISADVEKLRIRKEKIEELIAALKPFVGAEEQEAPSTTVELPAKQAEPAPVAQAEAAASAEPKAEQPDEQTSVITDPFQRRIDHVLGIGAGIRDVRKYNRQF
jgi:hypothetical protein